MVIKNYINIFFVSLIILFSKTLFSSQIYDYQTDEFIKKINSRIKSVNNYEKNINFRVINDNFPNAYVTEDNTLYLSSGLIIYSPDYVSFLAVLAHEIGHLEKYHVSKRKSEINTFKKINTLGNIFSIVGSMMMQKPDLINTIAINQTTINNLYINFTQDQEREADLYAVDTLNKLNLSTNSVKKLLMILEDKTSYDIADEELKKFSTHPVFKERYEILDSNKNLKPSNFEQKLENEFKFIKAKFLAYTASKNISELKNDEKKYYEAIHNAQSGKLIDSLKKLNYLITKYKNNYFFIETKADILLSYGFSKESVKFYKKVLDQFPENNYAKFNIFLNSNYEKKDKKIIEDIFYKNLNLFNFFPRNQNLFLKYHALSMVLEYKDWNSFFEDMLYEKNNLRKKLIELNNKTKDNNLKKLIKLYI